MSEIAVCIHGYSCADGEIIPKHCPTCNAPRIVTDDSNPKDKLGALKPQLSLVPASAMIYEAKVFALGARKYGAYNWRTKKVRHTVYLEAALRHILSALDGEDADQESGEPHEAHARACMGIILDAKATGNLIDDRPTKGAAGRLIAELTIKAVEPKG